MAGSVSTSLRTPTNHDTSRAARYASSARTALTIRSLRVRRSVSRSRRASTASRSRAFSSTLPYLSRSTGDPTTEDSVQAQFSVSVAKDYLLFAAAHFITMKGHQCESLHGHNYRVGLTVEGSIEPEPLWVVDFSLLKEIARPLVKAMDHKVILPRASAKLEVTEEEDRVRVTVFGEPRYVFPRRDCAILPIENSTAEMLARHLADQVRAALEERGVRHLTALEVEVEESPGQVAVCRVTLP